MRALPAACHGFSATAVAGVTATRPRQGKEGPPSSGRAGVRAMPFGRDLPPADLHRHAVHTEAAARAAWTIGHIGNHRNQNMLNGHLRETWAA
jgi:hypothetical protein